MWRGGIGVGGIGSVCISLIAIATIYLSPDPAWTWGHITDHLLLVSLPHPLTVSYYFNSDGEREYFLYNNYWYYSALTKMHL